MNEGFNFSPVLVLVLESLLRIYMKIRRKEAIVGLIPNRKSVASLGSSQDPYLFYSRQSWYNGYLEHIFINLNIKREVLERTVGLIWD